MRRIMLVAATDSSCVLSSAGAAGPRVAASATRRCLRRQGRPAGWRCLSKDDSLQFKSTGLGVARRWGGAAELTPTSPRTPSQGG